MSFETFLLHVKAIVGDEETGARCSEDVLKAVEAGKGTKQDIKNDLQKIENWVD